MHLPISVLENVVPLQVSKSRKLPILISADEMKQLFAALGDFMIFDVSRPVAADQMQISREAFLEQYARYVEGIWKGELVDESSLRPFFSAVFTTTPDALYALALANGKYLIKVREPVVQLQRHHFIFSDTFHSGVMGEGSVTWGIQFSYPQLYIDAETQAIGKVAKNEKFSNTELFNRLAKWVRSYTSATPFMIEKKQVNQPMRLGKKCFDLIQTHPMLKEKKLYVARRKNSQSTH